MGTGVSKRGTPEPSADAYHPSFRDRRRVAHRRDVLDRLHDVIRPDGTRLLDLGGGTGAPASVFARGAREVVVLDPNERKASRGRSTNAPVTFVTGVAESLPYGPGRFDRVVSMMSFHHFPDGDQALREAARVLTPDGRLAVYDFDGSRWPGTWFGFLEGRLRGHPGRLMGPTELERKMLTAGFSRVQSERLRSGMLVVADR